MQIPYKLSAKSTFKSVLNTEKTAKKVRLNKNKKHRWKSDEEKRILEAYHLIDPKWSQKTIDYLNAMLSLNEMQIYKWGYFKNKKASSKKTSRTSKGSLPENSAKSPCFNSIVDELVVENYKSEYDLTAMERRVYDKLATALKQTYKDRNYKAVKGDKLQSELRKIISNVKTEIDREESKNLVMSTPKIEDSRWTDLEPENSKIEEFRSNSFEIKASGQNYHDQEEHKNLNNHENSKIEDGIKNSSGAFNGQRFDYLEMSKWQDPEEFRINKVESFFRNEPEDLDCLSFGNFTQFATSSQEILSGMTDEIFKSEELDFQEFWAGMKENSFTRF